MQDAQNILCYSRVFFDMHVNICKERFICKKRSRVGDVKPFTCSSIYRIK